jgi:hypothetical protein
MELFHFMDYRPSCFSMKKCEYVNGRVLTLLGVSHLASYASSKWAKLDETAMLLNTFSATFKSGRLSENILQLFYLLITYIS